MKHVKGILIGGTAAILLVCIFVTITSPRYKASKLLSTDLPRPITTQWSDTHGGSFGEGELYGKFLFSASDQKNLDNVLSSSENWHTLPFPEDVNILLYGGEKYGENYQFKLADGWGETTVTRGYYYFYDRLHHTTSDTQLLESSSLDVTIGLYDSERGVLYVMTYDS